MRRTVVQSSLAASAVLGIGMACAAGGEPDARLEGVDTPSAPRIVPIGLDQPGPLAAGGACVGVVSRVIPNAESDAEPYWGCFEAGTLDRAFTTGVITPPPILLSPPSSELHFDASELEELEADEETFLEKHQPDLEIIQK